MVFLLHFVNMHQASASALHNHEGEFEVSRNTELAIVT